jgi:hypothetical protein
MIVGGMILFYGYLLSKYVGTGYGPQDYKKENPIVLMLSRLVEILSVYNYGAVMAMVLLLILVGFICIHNMDFFRKIFFKELLDLSLILIISLVTQVYVYRGYGFVDKRYLIPSTIVIGFFITYLINYYKQQIAKKTEKIVQQTSYFLVLSPVLLIPFSNMSYISQNISSFSSVGHEVTKLLNIVKDNTHAKGTILMVSDLSYVPCPEDFGAFKVYLRDYLHIHNPILYQGIMGDSVYFKNLDSNYQNYLLGFDKSQHANKVIDESAYNTVNNILLYEHTQELFIRQNAWFKLNNFSVFKAKGMVYLKKKHL